MDIEEYEIDVAQGIRFYREKLGITQGEVHRRTGFDRSYVYRMEHGRIKDLRIRTVLKLARAFEVTADEFIKKCLIPKEAAASD